jgi:hypothetical protein
MSSDYPKVKSCRLCRYYELETNFCAVNPDYIGIAHLCHDFALRVPIHPTREAEETKNLTRFIFDQFSKDYLEKLLLPYGEVEAGRTVAGEVREIDVWFVPSEAERPRELGLLGRLSRPSASALLFEPYRNPVSAAEISDCLLKLLEVRGDLQRQANRENRAFPLSEWPRLWILTPTASEAMVGGFGGQLSENWERGIYFLPDSLRTALVVIHQLPRTEETLWLRLLGRGRVQAIAIDDLEALPADHPLRSVTLELLYTLQKNLEVNQDKDEEERELIMRLAPLYQQDREKAVQEGKQTGEATLVLRQLNRRLGQVAASVEKQVRQLPVEQLEDLGEALLDFQSEADLLHWLGSDGR